MTRYYYDKYETVPKYIWEGTTRRQTSIQVDALYKSIETDEREGSVTGVSEVTGTVLQPPKYSIEGNFYYEIDSDSYQAELYYSGGRVGDNSPDAEMLITEYKRVAVEGQLKGTFLETIIAEDGEYPDDGRVKEGGTYYWYIKRDTAETAAITSPSGGERIHDFFTIEWTKSSRDVLVDIDLSFDNGLNWGELVYGLDGTSYEYNFVDENETSQARMRIRTVTDEGVGEWFENDGVFSISHDLPPSTPTHLQPRNRTIDRTIPQRFSWKHYHANPQSKFDLEWSVDQRNWNRISKTTSNEYADIDSNTFPQGEIFWRVRTYSDAGVESEWSDRAVFVAGEPSNEPIISSANQFTTATPTFTWVQPDQIAYQIILEDTNSNIIWDSGEVPSENRSATSGASLSNNMTYTLKLRTQTELGLWTEYVEQEIYISFTPPARPIIELILSDTFISININNPTPTNNNVEVGYNEVFRDGKRIATKVGSNYKDYTARSGKEHTYRVRAVGVNGGTNESKYHRATLEIKSISILGTMQDELVELKYNPEREKTKNKLGIKMFFAGRARPVMQYEEHIENNLNLSFKIMSKEQASLFEEIASTKELLIYRDNRGRKMFGTIQNYSIVDDTRHLGHYDVSFMFEELDYSEVV